MQELPLRGEIERLSSIAIPIVGLRHFDTPFPEGITSPKECAVTPPGVLTKLESLKRTPPITARVTANIKAAVTVTKVMPTGMERPKCECCEKRSACICKKCTLEKLSFYSRKENVSIKLKEKRRLESEVNAVMEETLSLQMNIADLRARVLTKSRELEERKRALDLKKLERTKMSEDATMSRRMITKLEDVLVRLKRNDDDRSERVVRRRQQLYEKETDLSNARKSLALLLFGIFPIREVQAMAESTHFDVVKSKVWTIITGASEVVPQQGTLFQVRDAVCGLDSPSCRASFSLSLSSGALSLSKDQRGHLAALIHSVQLINVLAQIYDHRLEYSMSLREMCLCDRWSSEIIETDWFKLCFGVLELCTLLGVNPEETSFGSPHRNLMSLARRLLSDEEVSITNVLVFSEAHLTQILNAQEKMKWKERVSMVDDWDICDDAKEL